MMKVLKKIFLLGILLVGVGGCAWGYSVSDLSKAVANDDVGVVKQIVGEFCNLFAASVKSKKELASALQTAISSKESQIVKVVFEKAVEIGLKNKTTIIRNNVEVGRTIIGTAFQAVFKEKRNTSVVEIDKKVLKIPFEIALKVLAKGEKLPMEMALEQFRGDDEELGRVVDKIKINGSPLLWYAFEFNEIQSNSEIEKIISWFKKLGADLNVKYRGSGGFLHKLIIWFSRGRIDFESTIRWVQKVLDYGIDPDKMANGWVPLSLAVSFYFEKNQEIRKDTWLVIVNSLLNKAKVDVQDHKGNTPLHLAALHGDSALVKRFLNEDTALKENISGHTPLHFALDSVYSYLFDYRKSLLSWKNYFSGLLWKPVTISEEFMKNYQNIVRMILEKMEVEAAREIINKKVQQKSLIERRISIADMISEIDEILMAPSPAKVWVIDALNPASALFDPIRKLIVDKK